MPAQETSRLIKASAARPAGADTSFPLDDLRGRCDELVARARRQSEKILAEAAAEADRIRDRGFSEGFADGRETGLLAAQERLEARARELAEEALRDRLRTSLAALETAAEQLAAERDRWLSAWEAAALRLSAAMARRIIHRELAHQPALAGNLVREALRLAGGSPQITLRLNPADLQQLHDCGDEITHRLARIGQAALTPDAGVSAGGCLIETRHGVIDARIETQLARIVAELQEHPHEGV
jgi:flagellar biosynthesis/type III secretory pathway protein FliH